ncbi:Glucokinase [Thalassocella blandensis]|nr:Glucokinase [Thalassocella blandensis]
MFPYIVADIGGTNARFALVTGKNSGQYSIEHINILSGADYPTFSAAMQAYIESLEGVKPRAACVAIAGPIGGDQVKMTNLNWSFSKKQIQAEFNFAAFDAINDFAAVAIATSKLSSNDLVSIKKGEEIANANKAIIGPGTGLGVAGLVYGKGQWIPVPSEGGHVNIPPSSEFECEVIAAAIKRLGHVSAESFISGPGLVNLYNAISDVKGEAAKALSPKDITDTALDNSDSTCHTTLETFCGFLGSVSGNLVLTYGAKGGVYLAGGILPRFVDFLRNSSFAEKFSSKGIMSAYVEDVPVNMIGYDQIAFLGAAAWLEQLQ